MNEVKTKICTKCGLEKSITEFWKRSETRSGYYARCKSCTNTANNQYRSLDRPKWRLIHNQSWKLLRLEVIFAYGGKCACCGESRYEFLALDHVNGGGKQHRASLSKDGTGQNTYAVYASVKKEGFPNTYRILCHNCNQSRGYYGYCPHERNR